MNPKNPPLQKIGLNTVVSFIIIFTINWLVLDWTKRIETEQVRAEYQTELNLYSDLISQQANLQFAQLEGLYTFTKAQLETNREIDEIIFYQYAKNLHANLATIRNMSIAPMGVQTYVYPIEGNENVPGHDLMQDEREHVRQDIQRALATQSLTLSDPYPLRQGGLGLVARQAIFLDDQFWGLVTMVLDVPPIFEISGITKVNTLRFAVINNQGDFFYGDEGTLTKDPIYSSIQLPEGEWQLAAVPINGWESLVDINLRSVRIMVWVITALLTMTIGAFSATTFLVQQDYQKTKQSLALNTETLMAVEDELKLQEEKVLQLTEHALDCVYRIGFIPEMRIEYINPVIEALSGYETREFIKNPRLFQKIHRAPHGKEVFDFLESSYPGQNQSTQEFLWIKKDGKSIWVEEKNVYRYDKNGQLHSLEGIARDITAIKELEFSLRESETKFRQLAEGIREIFWLRDQKSGAILYISPAYEEIWGKTSVSLYQNPQSFLDPIHPEDLPKVREDHIRLNTENTPFNQEYRITNTRGELRWIRARTFPIIEDGEIIRHAGIAEDITAEKLIQNQQKIINDLSESLRMVNDSETMSSVLMNRIASYYNVKTASINFIDKEAKQIIVSKATGKFKPFEGTYLPLNRGLIANSLHTLRIFWTNNIDEEPKILEEHKEAYTKCLTIIPLISEHQAIGAIALGKDEPFYEWEIHQLEALGNIAGNALRRTFTHEALLTSIEQLSVIHEIDTLITNEEEFETIISKVFKIAAKQFVVDTVKLYQYEEDAHQCHLLAQTKPCTDDVQPIPCINLLCETALMEQKVFTISNLHEYKGKNQKLVQTMIDKGCTWYHAIPLVSKTKTIGIIECIHRDPFFPQDSWLNFMDTFADQLALAYENTNLINQLKQVNLELTAAYDKTLEGWAKALDLRDHETNHHSQRVADLTLKIAKQFNFSAEEMIHIRRGALLHDIGKIGIPDQILLKPGKLDQKEWEMMRQHPQIGFDMLEKIDYLRPALNIPLYHHEKWDGTGYPFGLKGEEIPLPARIFALVDVWDALTSKRPYREAWSEIAAYKYIMEQSSMHFDPQVVHAFRELYLNDQVFLNNTDTPTEQKNKNGLAV